MTQGMIAVKLVDSLDNDQPINLDGLTRTGRQMVRDDLNTFLEKLDLLDEEEDQQ